ncbi:MAG: helix-turn-helix domain-containing protein [Clostridiales bacterium]|nr:helix-turn-helix domain-containing protein [Clostridiales bacterium]
MAEEEYIQLKEAAEMWGVSVRRVQTLCAEGRIPGAKRMGRDWVIPTTAQKPRDGRTRAGREVYGGNTDVDMPMPLKTPFLYMSRMYYAPGCAEEAIKRLEYNFEAQTIFSSEIALARGDIDKVYERANYLLEKHSGFYAILAAGTLLAHCAIWRGDLNMWRKAKIHIAEAGTKDHSKTELVSLCICAVDSLLYDVKDFPEWFKIGCFELLHKDSLPAAKVYYAKYLYATGYGIASQKIELEGIKGLALMGLLPATIEPMISQAMADNTVITEIYLRLICAVAYHYSKNDKQAIRHIDRAVAIALPDKLFGILAEYCRTLGSLLEQRVRAVDNEAWEKISGLYINYVNNWSRLNSKITGRQIVEKLSAQYREVARLAAFKLSDAEIAERMNMSVPGVKQAIRIIKQKSNLDRDDFAAIL